MKASITQLKADIADARTRQDLAAKDVKRIERDMSEFSNNKESKLAQLQTALDKLKKALSKNAASIKPLQQEMRSAMLDAEQCGSDLAAAEEQLRDTDTALATQNEEIEALIAEQNKAKVSGG